MFLFSSYGDRRTKTFGRRQIICCFVDINQSSSHTYSYKFSSETFDHIFSADRSKFVWKTSKHFHNHSSVKAGLHYQSFCDHSRNFA